MTEYIDKIKIGEKEYELRDSRLGDIFLTADGSEERKLKIGNTEITETQLQSLLALLTSEE